MKYKQRVLLKKEVSPSRTELGSQRDNFHVFVKTREQAMQSAEIPLSQFQFEVGSTVSENNFFHQRFTDIKIHCDKQKGLVFLTQWKLYLFPRETEC